MLETQQVFAAIANNQEQQKGEMSNKRVCHAFNRTGTCKFGDRCRFDHVRPECAKFKKGSCTYGDTCRLVHSTAPARQDAKVAAVAAKSTLYNQQKRYGNSDSM